MPPPCDCGCRRCVWMNLYKRVWMCASVMLAPARTWSFIYIHLPVISVSRWNTHKNELVANALATWTGGVSSRHSCVNGSPLLHFANWRDLNKHIFSRNLWHTHLLILIIFLAPIRQAPSSLHCSLNFSQTFHTNTHTFTLKYAQSHITHDCRQPGYSE